MSGNTPSANFSGSTRWPKTALWGVAAYYVGEHFGPALVFDDFDVIKGFATLMFTDAAFSFASSRLWWLGNIFNSKAVETPIGAKGEAAFADDLFEISDELTTDGSGIYVGAHNGVAVTPKLESNVTILGPTGSKKTAGIIIPNMWWIKHSKIILDFKGELYHVMAPALRQRGETVHAFNIGDRDLGPNAKPAFYNLLSGIQQNYTHTGGLLNVSDDVFKFVDQLIPDPQTGKDGNDYFREGSRELVSFAIQMTILVQGPTANLGHVAALLNDREALKNNALWACGKLPAKLDLSNATHDTWRTIN